MKKLFLAIGATAASLLVLLPAKHVLAANFGFTVGEDFENPRSTPLSIGLYLYQNIVSAQGQVTSTDGFSSLQGVNSNSLTFNFGNLQLLNFQETSNQVTTNLGSNGQQTPFFNLLQNGQVIATSNQITITETSADSLNVPSTQKIDITLNGVSGSPFFQEVNQLTNGTNVLELNGTTGNGTAGTTGYTFTYTGNGSTIGNGSPVGTPTTEIPTAVPEPSSLWFNTLIVGLGGVGCLLKRKFKTNGKLAATDR